MCTPKSLLDRQKVLRDLTKIARNHAVGLQKQIFCSLQRVTHSVTALYRPRFFGGRHACVSGVLFYTSNTA